MVESFDIFISYNFFRLQGGVVTPHSNTAINMDTIGRRKGLLNPVMLGAFSSRKMAKVSSETENYTSDVV